MYTTIKHCVLKELECIGPLIGKNTFACVLILQSDLSKALLLLSESSVHMQSCFERLYIASYMHVVHKHIMPRS